MKIPKVGTKVIRISGCHDDKLYGYDGWFCKHPDMEKFVDISNYVKTKTLPGNCPLDDSPDSFNPAGISRGEIEAISDISSPAKFDKQYKGSAK